MGFTSRLAIGAALVVVLGGGAAGYRRWKAVDVAVHPAVARKAMACAQRRHDERSGLAYLEKMLERMLHDGVSSNDRADWEAVVSRHLARGRERLASVLAELDAAHNAESRMGSLIRAAGEPYNRRPDGKSPDISAERTKLQEAAEAHRTRAREAFRRVVAAVSAPPEDDCKGVTG